MEDSEIVGLLTAAVEKISGRIRGICLHSMVGAFAVPLDHCKANDMVGGASADDTYYFLA